MRREEEIWQRWNSDPAIGGGFTFGALNGELDWLVRVARAAREVNRVVIPASEDSPDFGPLLILHRVLDEGDD